MTMYCESLRVYLQKKKELIFPFYCSDLTVDILGNGSILLDIIGETLLER